MTSIPWRVGITLFITNIISHLIPVQAVGINWCYMQIIFNLMLIVASYKDKVMTTYFILCAVLGVALQLLFLHDYYYWSDFVYSNYPEQEAALFYLMLFGVIYSSIEGYKNGYSPAVR